MDDLLNEYMELSNDTTTSVSPDSQQQQQCTNNTREQAEYDDYITRTKEYYHKMSCRDFFRALWFSASSLHICAAEYVKYKIGWKSRNHAIIDVSKRLAAKNMMYVKIFQAFATNRNIVSPELNQFFSEYTDM